MYLNLSFVILAFVLATTAGPVSQPTTQPQTATVYSKRSSLSLRDENGRFDHSKAKLQTKRTVAKTTRMSNAGKNVQKKDLLDKALDSQSSSEGCGQNPQSVCITIVNDNGAAPIGDVFVGSPGQQFIEVFDTGSSDLLIPGVNCTTCTLAQHFYDPTKSTTSVSLNQTLETSFGAPVNASSTTEAGATIFQEFTDTVTLGGITIEDVTVSVMTQENGELVTPFFEGIFGLGPPALSAAGDNANAVIKAWQQGRIPKPQFSLALSANESELFMGGQNPARFQGQTEFHSVISRFGWIIGDATMSTNIGVGFNRIITLIDSATSNILAPPNVAAAFYSEIPGSELIDEVNGFYTIPCSSIPNIQISFSWSGGSNFSVDPDLLNLGQNGNDTENCIYGLQAGVIDLGIPGQSNNNYWIAGALFMQTVYSTFDFEQNLIGFSTLVN